MKSTSHTLSVLMVGLVLGITLAIGHGVLAEREAAPSSALPLNELRSFTEVFARIKEDYVEPVGDKELLESAIRGMLAGLDPHSAYLNTEDYKELQVGTTGEFGGLGIEVGMSEDGFVKVITPIDDTPAQRAGIKPGDLIIRLDAQPVKGMALQDAVNLMRGKVGTDITLTVMREGQEKPLKFVLTRDVIRVKSVKSRLVDKNYGYVRITQFQSHTGDNLEEAVAKLKEEALAKFKKDSEGKAKDGDAKPKEGDGKLKGLVLDLRNNPGGVLNAAVDVADAFLDKGLIVYTKGRRADSEMKFSATPKQIVEDIPLIVLVNGGSASASEIVAGALQDHKRAIIMGTRTFGKGSVQTILPLNNETALKITTARYYTPLGRSIQAEGIEPDIVLDPLKVATVEQADGLHLKEADLAGHLGNGKEGKDDKGAKQDEAAPAPETPKGKDKDKDGAKTKPKAEAVEPSLAESDYQLFEAVNLLKGLQFLRR